MNRRHSHRVVVIGLVALGLLFPSAVSIAQEEDTGPKEQAVRLLEFQSQMQLADERAKLQQAQTQLEQQRLELEKMRLDLEKQQEKARREIQDGHEKLDRRQQESEWTTQIFKIEHTDAEQLQNILEMFGGNTTYSRDPDVITVNGSEETLAAVEAAIRTLDVPSEPEPKPNIQLIVYTLEAVVPGGSPEFGEQAVPDDLESVVTELRNVFPYDDFRLVDTLLVRCRDGSGAETSTYLPIATGKEFTRGLAFRLSARPTVTADAGPAGALAARQPAWIRIDGFTFAVVAESYRPPAPLAEGGRAVRRSSSGKQSRQLIGLNTEIDMREGQKVVVGKGNAEMSSNALFAVVTAKVVD